MAPTPRRPQSPLTELNGTAADAEPLTPCWRDANDTAAVRSPRQPEAHLTGQQTQPFPTP